jgi:integrase
MTTAQAASACGLERQPILNAINKGKLPGRKQMDGKTSTWLVKPADLERVFKIKLKTPDVSSVHLAIYILQFLLLNPTRYSQVGLLPWREIKGDMWTCPPDRHKAGHKHGREYLIPLSADSMKILEIMRARNIDSPYVFARGHTPAGMNLFLGEPLSREAVIKHLRRISGHPTITLHSFRRNFSSWANDQDRFSRETIETMLGHTWGNASERAYTLDARRIRSCRRLSQDWADFVMGRSQPAQTSETPSADIIPLQAIS